MGPPVTVSFVLRGALVTLLVAIALSGSAGFRHQPRSAEAALAVEVKKLTASVPEAHQTFAHSVAVSGDTAVVAALGERVVYVFQREQGGAGNWGEVKVLISADPEESVSFGGSVAVSGDVVVVGAEDEDAGVSKAGAAHVYQRHEGGANNWGEVKKLTASDPQTSASFGKDVAVSGNTVVVGSSSADAPDLDSGAAYVFQRNWAGVDNWGQVKKLTASDGQEGIRFGRSVAASGDTVIVSSTADFGVPGAGYVFQRDEGGTNNWGEVAKVTGSDAERLDSYGLNIALSGDTAIVSAYHDDDDGQSSGAAYLYERDAGGADNWGEVKKLTASNAEALDAFGSGVAVSGDTAIVGAFGEDSGGDLAGAAYIFKQNEGGVGNWGELKQLVASDAGDGDSFGLSVAVSGDTHVVGAREEDSAGVRSGAAYVFEAAKQTGPGDTDFDGCEDLAESGPDASFGGLRDYFYFWDFYDVWTHPTGDPLGWERNRVVNIFDILQTAIRFGPGPKFNKVDAFFQALVPPADESSYHPAYDRGPIIGANDWDRAPPDASINIVDDILGVAAQFGHSCA